MGPKQNRKRKTVVIWSFYWHILPFYKLHHVVLRKTSNTISNIMMIIWKVKSHVELRLKLNPTIYKNIRASERVCVCVCYPFFIVSSTTEIRNVRQSSINQSLPPCVTVTTYVVYLFAVRICLCVLGWTFMEDITRLISPKIITLFIGKRSF